MMKFQRKGFSGGTDTQRHRDAPARQMLCRGFLQGTFFLGKNSAYLPEGI